MNLGLKEIKKNKAKFFILGSIVFLVSLLTFVISGLANGLSQDNASLIKDLPQGQFYMNSEAEEAYNLSRIDGHLQEEILNNHDGATVFSIQMGSLNKADDRQESAVFVASTESELFSHVQTGEIILNNGMEDKGIEVGDVLTNAQFSGKFVVKGFADDKKLSHQDVVFIHPDNYKEMYLVDEMQLVFIPQENAPAEIAGLQSFSNQEFLGTIASYNAEQLTLNMIIWFLIVISGMLFAIFFYMMNVQKIGLYGILKAIGLKTSRLFSMMWTQMLVITITSLVVAIAISQSFNFIAPEGMPFHLTIETTLTLSLVFLIIGFLGTTIASFQIKKVQPLQAIQQGEM